MAMSVFTFLLPCWAMPLEHWQCLFYFPALCDSIVHYVCICVCVCVCVCVYASTCARVGDRAICTMDFHGYVSDPR